nr:hypothetical protein [uncultured Brevundimonas sp.]
MFADARSKIRQYGAVGIQPISADSTTSGALKGAAWGLILAGPLGLAVGSMVGGGMKVAFELRTLEGETLKCIATKGAYLDIKKQVETRPAQPKPPKNVRVRHEGPRTVGVGLLVGLALFPLVFVWLLLRRDHTVRARILGAAWTVIWCIGVGSMPASPPEPAAEAVTASGIT